MDEIRLQAFGLAKGVGVAKGAMLREVRRKDITAPMRRAARDLKDIGTKYALRVVDRAVGAIGDAPLYKSVIEKRGRMRIEWNTAPFGDE